MNKKLELSIEEHDGHVKIYCIHNGCVWNWHTASASDEVTGRALNSAIDHAFNKVHDE